ncbi:mandelate racemase/muconate lactonizing enzyme family protein [Actibacterium mucosum]|uniref:mandelate racemase/muconate lactonizing enzyme family protein n=1 Tax=Actibacterium mucosum TaxID=1087332 RepID=UPI000A434C49|nr:mandelate racemase/muconate lactonizing enzyme family protein [Actibacterium mucosum]
MNSIAPQSLTRPRLSQLDLHMVGATWCNYLFVQLTTDEGVTGLGEATMQYQSKAVAAAAEHLFERYLKGQDPFEIERAIAVMYREEYARGGPVLNSAIAGLEMAMWDICGKITGQPVHRLLGGAVRDSVPAYANAWFGGAETEEDWASAAVSAVARGYEALKFDPFWPDGRDPSPRRLRVGLRIIQAVSDAVGPDIRLLIDGHGRFSPGTAAELAYGMSELGVHWFEEPVDPENFGALGNVPRAPGLRIAAGERCWSRYKVPALIAQGRPDVLQPDPIQVGGILESRKIAAIAESHYLPVSFHNPFGPVATAAVVQLDAGITNMYLQEAFCEFADPLWFDVLKNAPRPVNGSFPVSDQPGLGGIELNMDAVAEHPYRDGAYISIWGGSRDFND